MPTLAIYGVAALALLLSGFGTGWKVASDHAKAEQLAAVQAAETARRQTEQQLNAASAALEQERAKQHVVYKTITKTVDRIVQAPGYDRVCLDDSGLRAANAALAGAAADPGQPDQPVPGSLPSGGGNGSGSPQKAR